jgi:hypothetical protein
MKNMLLAGTAAFSIVIGAASAFAANNPNVPSWSPYAVMAYDGNSGYGNNPFYPGADEGRSAYVEPRQINNGWQYGTDPHPVNSGYDNQRSNSAYPNEGRAAYVEPGWNGGGDWQYRDNSDPHPINSGYDNQRTNSAYPN